MCAGQTESSAKKKQSFSTGEFFIFHKYIERLLSEGEDISELAKQLKEKNPDLILVTDEIGYGIVPDGPISQRSTGNYRAASVQSMLKDAKSV